MCGFVNVQTVHTYVRMNGTSACDSKTRRNVYDSCHKHRSHSNSQGTQQRQWKPLALAGDQSSAGQTVTIRGRGTNTTYRHTILCTE